MKLSYYQEAAARTRIAGRDQETDISNAVLGIAGEAGELANAWKKVQYHGHKLEHSSLIGEIGDILWYCAELCTSLGLSLDEVAEMNILKLKARYPNGFESQRSINRAE